jgi:DNA-binding ferritin-like protein (Dps family)
MKHLLKNVSAVEHYILLAEFQNGEKRYYDVSPWIQKNKAFKPLESVKGLFEQMSIDVRGIAVIWNEDIDLYCDELYENGIAYKCCN